MRRISAVVAAAAVCSTVVWGVATATTPPARLTLWTTQLGTPQADVGAAVAVGANGTTCVYGQTEGNFQASDTPSKDVFVACYDRAGKRKWVRQLGTTGTESPSNTFAVASNGDVYIAGTTDAEFPDQFAAGGEDVFVAKYDRNGVLRYVKQFGGRYDDQAWGLTRSSTGDLYLVVETSSDDFPSGSLSPNVYVDKTDSVIVRMSRNADLKWARQFGTSENDWAWSVAVSRQGDAYVVGTTFADLDGAGPEQFHSSDHSKGDGFVVRFDRDGRRVWTRQIGTSDDDQLYGIALDKSNNVYVAGFTRGALGNLGVAGNAGGYDGVVLKLTKDGDDRWAHQHGTAADETEWGITVDKKDNVYIGGYTNGAVAGYANLGGTDAYLLHLNTAGESESYRQFGTPGDDATERYGVPIWVSTRGIVAIAGTTNSAVWGQPNAGSTDVFLTQLPGF